MSVLPIGLRPADGSAAAAFDHVTNDPPERRPAPAHAQHDAVVRRTPHAPALRDAARAVGFPAAASAETSAHGGLVEALLAHVPAADRPAAKTAIPAILAAAERTGTSDPNRLGYLLATAQTESDFGAHMVEGGHAPAWFERNYGCQDGNRPGTNDGYTYRGRGYVQTTHAGRYAELSRRLGLPDVPQVDRGRPVLDRDGRPKLEPQLVARPDALTDPRMAARALVVGVEQNLFTRNRAAALDKTIPTGRPAGHADFYHARALVNGIVEDQAREIASHAATYARIIDTYRHVGSGGVARTDAR